MIMVKMTTHATRSRTPTIRKAGSLSQLMAAKKEDACLCRHLSFLTFIHHNYFKFLMNESYIKRGLLVIAGLAALCLLATLHAQAVVVAVPDAVATLAKGIDTLWVLLGAFLVFFMQIGFAIREADLCR